MFVREGIQYNRVNVTSELSVGLEVWSSTGRFSVIHFYNPCLKLEVEMLDEVMGQVRSPVVCTGDFNAHNPLWGSKCKDKNGAILEDFLDKHLLVILNDGRLGISGW